MNLAKVLWKLMQPKKKEKEIHLAWRGDWSYILKQGKPVGHISFFITDEETKTKIINLLKLLEK